MLARHRCIFEGVALSECLQKLRRVFPLNVVSMLWTLFVFLLMLWVGECFNISHPTHCWIHSRNCTGSISQSFGQESECCKQGGKSYIKCSNQELEQILTQINKPQHCVPCPVKPAKKISKPYGKCLPSTCPKPNERCVESAKTKTTSCVKCANITCDSSGQRVCGSDKKTYKNECALLCTKANIYIAYQGRCVANPKCSSIKCKKEFKCLQLNGEVRCLYASSVVCGFNGKTYASVSDLERHACHKQYQRRGPCKPTDKPIVVPRGVKMCKSNFASSFSIWGK